MKPQWSPATCVAFAAVLCLVCGPRRAAADSLRQHGHLSAGEGQEPDSFNKQHEVKIPGVHIPGGDEISLTYEGLFAILFILIIAGGPLLISQLAPEKMTRTAWVQAVTTVIMLVGGIVLFTNVIQFQSSHFQGQRPLTIVESVYVLSQMITTVGYGDITPALPRGQVVIGFYVLCCIMLIADMVSQVSSIVVGRVERYSQTVADAATRKFAKGLRHQESLLEGPSKDEDQEEIEVKAVKFVEVPHIPLMPMLSSGLSVALFLVIGVLFWHYFPGEGKTWLQAIYMSVITLSTVGFGAFTASTESGKVFGAFWMLFGVAALVSFVGAFTEFMLKMKERERFNVDNVQREMEENICQLDVADHEKVDKYQFFRFALLQCHLATKEQLQDIDAEFQRLKRLSPDGDGLVSIKTLQDEDFPKVAASPAA